MSKKKKSPSLNKKLQYDEHGNIIVGTFKNQEKMYFDLSVCRCGAFDDKRPSNRKGKAAQKERNKLRKGEWDE